MRQSAFVLLADLDFIRRLDRLYVLSALAVLSQDLLKRLCARYVEQGQSLTVFRAA